VWIVSALVHVLVVIKYTIKLKPLVAIAPLLRDRRERGMSGRYDAIDWIGGFPYEFCRYEVLESYLTLRGFRVMNHRCDGSQGCNELVAERAGGSAACAE
jgi:hypothetical protein